MIRVNNESLTENKAAKVLLCKALEVVKSSMSEEFKQHVGLDLQNLTEREKNNLDESIAKWCSRLQKNLNINFKCPEPISEKEVEEVLEYFQLKSGGFAAKGYYHE